MTHEFNEWINIYYTDDNLMAKAFETIEKYETSRT